MPILLIRSEQDDFVKKCKTNSCACEDNEVTPNDTPLQHPNNDADLQQIIQAWPTLPVTLKSRIVGDD